MNKLALAGAAIAAVVAIPALAQPSAAGAGAGPTTRVELQQLIEAQFAQVDANKDGFITEAELAGADAALPGRFISRIDADKDGKASLAELSTRMLAMFDQADADKDGSVTAEERKVARDAIRVGAEQKGQKGR